MLPEESSVTSKHVNQDLPFWAKIWHLHSKKQKLYRDDNREVENRNESPRLMIFYWKVILLDFIYYMALYAKQGSDIHSEEPHNKPWSMD